MVLPGKETMSTCILGLCLLWKNKNVPVYNTSLRIKKGRYEEGTAYQRERKTFEICVGFVILRSLNKLNDKINRVKSRKEFLFTCL